MPEVGGSGYFAGQNVGVSGDEQRYALGVDTGGTYTDAVVYDETRRTIVAKAKAPTTHDDLAVGIAAAIEGAVARSPADPGAIEMVSLSTTLARTRADVVVMRWAVGRGAPCEVFTRVAGPR